jgi:hypothetical protein
MNAAVAYFMPVPIPRLLVAVNDTRTTPGETGRHQRVVLYLHPLNWRADMAQASEYADGLAHCAQSFK